MAIDNISLRTNFRVLDLCTGTGDIAIYTAKNIVRDGSVVGVDFSSNMLDIARRKAIGVENVEFVLGDAMNLPFDDAQFDACIISFGLRNLPDFKGALVEMKRVTKEGGVISSLDTGKPEGFFKLFHYLFFFKIVPVLGRFFNGNDSPYKYLPQSTKNFPDAGKLVELFEAVGLKNVRRFDFLFGSISQQAATV